MKQFLKRRIILGLASASALAAGMNASAALVTNPSDPRNWQGATVGTFAALYYGADTAANRQLVIDNKLLDDGVFDFTGATGATIIQTDASSTGTSLDTTGTGSFAYVQPGGTVVAAGSAIDQSWIQNSPNIGGTIWDLGALSTKAAVFPTIDHGPLPQEAIESTVYLSNDKVTWTEAVVEKVWLEGWEPNTGILWDGFVYAVGTPGNTSFRYATMTHGGPGALQHDGDDEINGVMGLDANFRPSGVPDGGSTFALLGGAAALLGGIARKRRA